MLDTCCIKEHNNNILESNKLITHYRSIITRYNYCVSWGACKRFDLVDIILMMRTSFGSNNRAHQPRLMYDLFMATSWHSIFGSCICNVRDLFYNLLWAKFRTSFIAHGAKKDNHMIINVYKNAHFFCKLRLF